jgi:ATP phosphoribosyltransferase
MLVKLALPKGSLQESTFELMRKAGFHCTVSSRSYSPWVDDEELEIMLIRAQEIGRYVEDEVFDAGLTGKDWIVETGADVVEVAELVYAKHTRQPLRWVLAAPEASDIHSVQDLEGKRIATEVVNITEAYLKKHSVTAKVEFSWGATEAKAAEGLADAIVEVTETGGTIRAHGLRIVCDLLESAPQLIANKDAWQDPWKRAKIEQISMLLQGALAAEHQVGIKMNVMEDDLEKIIALIPSVTAPTVATLYDTPALKGKKWFSIESIIAEDVVRELIPELTRNGAVGIVEYPLNKVI